jgi:hypothetical protein
MPAAIALVVASACGGARAPVIRRAAGPAAAFETVYKALEHPRCRNCHIPGDAPLIGDDSVVHAQNVIRGPDGRGEVGIECSTCHGTTNLPDSYGEHVPPGAPRWRLPPPNAKMVFIGRSDSEVCLSLKDPHQNGGMDLSAVVEHLRADPLVLWGWTPGAGRAPVSVPHEELVAKAEQWAAAGGPCP